MSHHCRFCDAPLRRTFVDLGLSPLCESFVAADQLDQPERFYPLRVFVCERCLLVQLPAHVGGEEIFGEYAYFSSFSETWLRHAERFSLAAISRLGLGPDSQVVEVASNDGYLLRNFVDRGIPSLGIEPAANVARAAIAQGVPTHVDFLGRRLATELVERGVRADLLVANNVLAHVPDLHDFVDGLKLLLAPEGELSLEFPHLPRLIEGNQFDTIYHEHYSYFSLGSAKQVLAAHDLTIFDAESLPTHGGSVRVYARHAERREPAVTDRLREMCRQERDAGYDRLETYEGFAQRVVEVKRQLLEFLIAARREGKTVAGYGAPGKGNTLLNYCGIRQDCVDYTVDRNPYKQGKFLPGTRIPIFGPERIDETHPDYLLILPWNLRDEIMRQMAHVRQWGCRFVVPVPELCVC
jgi:SAM-dependent methyltransferase